LKPEWWGSPLAQQEKYQGQENPVIREKHNNSIFEFNSLFVIIIIIIIVIIIIIIILKLYYIYTTCSMSLMWICWFEHYYYYVVVVSVIGHLAVDATHKSK
jgi:hypothetical protein